MRLVLDWRVVRALSIPFIEQYNFLTKLPAAISKSRLEHWLLLKVLTLIV
jgi:hypothetical protein